MARRAISRTRSGRRSQSARRTRRSGIFKTWFARGFSDRMRAGAEVRAIRWRRAVKTAATRTGRLKPRQRRHAGWRQGEWKYAYAGWRPGEWNPDYSRLPERHGAATVPYTVHE